MASSSSGASVPPLPALRTPLPRPARRMNWNADVGARIARGTLITARTLEPFRPHAECDATAVACVVWSAHGSVSGPDSSPSPDTAGDAAAGSKGKGRAAESFDLTTWNTFAVLPIVRDLPVFNGRSADAEGRPYAPQLFFALHSGPEVDQPRGFGSLKTVPPWNGGRAYVYFPGLKRVKLRVHWDPFADCHEIPMRLAFGEEQRMLCYLKDVLGLPMGTAEEEVMEKLGGLGERMRGIATPPPLPPSEEVPLPLTPPMAPATPITPSNANTPSKNIPRKRDSAEFDGGFCCDPISSISPTCPPDKFVASNTLASPPLTGPPVQQPFSPVSIELDPISCANCGGTWTSLWRTRKETGQSLCNACAQYEKHHGTTRPPHMFKNEFKGRNRSNASKSPISPTLKRGAAPARGRKRGSLNKVSDSAPRKRSRIEKSEDVQVKLEAVEVLRVRSHDWMVLDALGYAPGEIPEVTEPESAPERKRRKTNVSFHVSGKKQFQLPKGAFGFLGTPYSPLSKLPTWLELIFSKADPNPMDTSYRIWPYENAEDIHRTIAVDLQTSSSHTTKWLTDGARAAPADAAAPPGPPDSPHSTSSNLPLTPLTQYSDEEFVFINEPPSPTLSSLKRQAATRDKLPPPAQPPVVACVSFDLSQASWAPDRYTTAGPRRWRSDACWLQREPPGMWRERGEIEDWVDEVDRSEPEYLRPGSAHGRRGKHVTC